MIDSVALVSTAYLPNIAWFQHILSAKKIILESKENYLKQSYRNRCKIFSANGIMELSIPVIKGNHKQMISSILTQESEPWRKQHWKSICSAYGNSAFFLYYKDHFEPIYLGEPTINLFDFNYQLIQLLFRLMKVDVTIEFSVLFEPYNKSGSDKRNFFVAKGIPSSNELLLYKSYQQVFSEKQAFQPNLSVIDLLFNVGPLSKDFLFSN